MNEAELPPQVIVLYSARLSLDQTEQLLSMLKDLGFEREDTTFMFTSEGRLRTRALEDARGNEVFIQDGGEIIKVSADKTCDPSIIEFLKSCKGETDE